MRSSRKRAVTRFLNSTTAITAHTTSITHAMTMPAIADPESPLVVESEVPVFALVVDESLLEAPPAAFRAVPVAPAPFAVVVPVPVAEVVVVVAGVATGFGVVAAGVAVGVGAGESRGVGLGLCGAGDGVGGAS